MRDIRTYGLTGGEVALAATPRRGSLLYKRALYIAMASGLLGDFGGEPADSTYGAGKCQHQTL